MNAYGLPDAQETAYYRLAHAHRSCLNCLRYSWRGAVADGCAPKTAADGSWDWTAWDRRFGPLLNGSAFADLPRGRTPVDEFYLPLNENWPMNHERAYRGGYWIENAYPDSYWAEFRAASRQFARHIAAKGWAETTFEFYLNDKVYFKAEQGSWSRCSAPWIFDEPVNTQDFWALRRFGREFLAAAGGAGISSSAAISRGPSGSEICSTASAARKSSADRCGRIATASWPGRRVRAEGFSLWQSEQDRHSESPVLRLVRGRLVPRRGWRRAVEHDRHRPVVDRAGPNLPVLSDGARPAAEPEAQGILPRPATCRVRCHLHTVGRSRPPFGGRSPAQGIGARWAAEEDLGG